MSAPSAGGRVVVVEDALRRAAELHGRGRFAEAEALYRRILASHPDDVDSWQRLAMLLQQQGRSEEALASLSEAVARAPDSAEARSNLGLVLQTLGRNEEALTRYDEALALRPDHVKALSNRGLTLQALGRPEEALASHERALAIRPDFPEALNHRGLALQLLGRIEDALASYDEALRLRPDHAETLNNRGAALAALKRPEEALACFDRALALRPDHCGAHYNRAAALNALDRPEEALACCDAALALQPERLSLLNARGLSLHRLNRQREALESYARALALTPDSDEVRWNASLAHLTLGEFGPGFAGFEARWKVPALGAGIAKLRRPLWLGEEPIEGRTLLLHAEQGLGDAIQFVRYVPLLAERGARILLRAAPELKAIFESLEGVQRVLSTGQRLPRYDLHCPLMSLPLACGTTLESVPGRVPYLSAPPRRVAAWRRRLGDATRPRIGLAWSGNPAHPSDHQRSLRLERLRPLLQRSGLEIVSLQKQVRDEDREALAASDVTHLGEELGDFADLAALVSLLDLVVSVDTAVAHLAGALARPVWILLPFCPDWRWLLGREDSPWYPTARLFRQTRPGDWEDVIARLAGALGARWAASAPVEAAR
jgi:tetratricopeptide (TPR) repeat protein